MLVFVAGGGIGTFGGHAEQLHFAFSASRARRAKVTCAQCACWRGDTALPHSHFVPVDAFCRESHMLQRASTIRAVVFCFYIWIIIARALGIQACMECVFLQRNQGYRYLSPIDINCLPSAKWYGVQRGFPQALWLFDGPDTVLAPNFTSSPPFPITFSLAIPNPSTTRCCGIYETPIRTSKDLWRIHRLMPQNKTHCTMTSA